MNYTRFIRPRSAATLACALTLAAPSVAAEPDISYEAILQGEEFDSGRAVVLDDAGDAYVLGYTVEQGDHDILVVKVDGEGQIAWSRQIGGSELDLANDLAIDADGGLLLVGRTLSPDFPVANALQTEKNGPSDAILLRLDASDGSIVQSTYLGGSRNDAINDVAVGADGAIYLAGYTGSIDLPVVNPIQDSLTLIHCFCDDAFVMKLSPAADEILFSTYLGGGFRDQAQAIEVDADGVVTIAGYTRSGEDFPIVNAAQPTFAGSEADLFVTRIDVDSPSIIYSTYLGGAGSEILGGLALDGAGRAIIGGSAATPTFPTTPDAYQPNYAGAINGCPAGLGFNRNCYDAFVTALSADGSAIEFSTFLGGDSDDECRDLVIDDDGRIHLAGYTFSADFPPAGIDTSGEIFAATLNSDGSGLVNVFTFDSGSANAGHGIAVDSDGETVLTGAIHVPSDLYVVRFAAPGGEGSRFDLNDSGAVDSDDLFMLLGAWGPCGGCPEDLDGSGAVDADDLFMLLGAWSA